MYSHIDLWTNDCIYAYRDASYQLAATRRRRDDSDYGSVRRVSPHPCCLSIYSSGNWRMQRCDDATQSFRSMHYTVQVAGSALSIFRLLIYLSEMLDEAYILLRHCMISTAQMSCLPRPGSAE